MFLLPSIRSPEGHVPNSSGLHAVQGAPQHGPSWLSPPQRPPPAPPLSSGHGSGWGSAGWCHLVTGGDDVLGGGIRG